MKAQWAGGMAAAAVVLAGCAGDQSAAIKNKLDDQADQLAKLETTVQNLKTEVDRIRKEPISPNELRAQIDPIVADKVKDQFKKEVAQTLESKLGTEQASGDVLKKVVDDQIVAFEEKKRQDREAEQKKREEEWAQRRQQFEQQQWDSLKKDLSLNDTQTEQLRAASEEIRTSIRTSMETMREQGNFDWDKAREQAEKMRAEYSTKLQGILAADQYTAYTNRPMNLLRMLEFGRDFGRGFGRGPGGGGDRGGGPGGGGGQGGGR